MFLSVVLKNSFFSTQISLSIEGRKLMAPIASAQYSNQLRSANMLFAESYAPVSKMMGREENTGYLTLQYSWFARFKYQKKLPTFNNRTLTHYILRGTLRLNQLSMETMAMTITGHTHFKLN
jgi:hypothetical protein